MFWMLGQHSLHDIRLQLVDQRIEQTSLFPFFDREGSIRALMLISQDSGDIALVPYRPGLFLHRLFRPSRLDLRRADLRNSRFRDAHRLARLWHFDPWWVLADKRYAHHSAVPTLRATNIVGFDKPFDRIWFDSVLSRALLVASGRGEATKVKRFSPGLLDKAEGKRSRSISQATAEKSSSEWRLRPFWETAGGATQGLPALRPTRWGTPGKSRSTRKVSLHVNHRILN